MGPVQGHGHCRYSFRSNYWRCLSLSQLQPLSLYEARHGQVRRLKCLNCFTLYILWKIKDILHVLCGCLSAFAWVGVSKMRSCHCWSDSEGDSGGNWWCIYSQASPCGECIAIDCLWGYGYGGWRGPARDIAIELVLNKGKIVELMVQIAYTVWSWRAC